MEGLFPPNLMYRIPLSREVPLAPLADERVLHFDFFGRGLGFPMHPFVRGLLFFFGYQLHHLDPHRSPSHRKFYYFLGMLLRDCPHLDMFHHFFCIRPQMNGSAIRDLGGVSLQLRSSSKFFPVDIPQLMLS